MHPRLEDDSKNISEILSHTAKLASEHFDNLDASPPSRLISDIAMADLPMKGIGAHATLEYFATHFADKLANSIGPRYFGFVTGGSTPASIAGDWLVSTYDQNACGSNDSIAPQIERQTIHFFKELFGLNLDYFGSFVTGATMANFSGLAIARQWVGQQQGIDVSDEGMSKPIRILSGTPHSSIMKSLSMLGVGRKSMVIIDTLPDREAIDVAKLETELRKSREPVIVVANAGTVNTVDFDDLVTIGALKSRYNFWLHVDAAFGGFAACSKKYSQYVDGINYADSITIDAHKWLNVPYDAAMQFTRHKDIQLRVFQNSAAYLGDASKSPDYFHYTPENSRRFRALPSWFTLIAYGKDAYTEIVERNCAVALYFGDLINSGDQFELLAPVRMNVVCFSLKSGEVTLKTINKFLAAVRDDGRVFFTPTVYKGRPGIRAAISNWRTEIHDIEVAFHVITSVSKELKKDVLSI